MQIRYISNVFLIILIIIFTSFFYFGVIKREPVSPDYNVPLAESIINGDFITVKSGDLYLYSPGSSHFILALFVLLGHPNLFGLLSWLVLFIMCKMLGTTFGLNKNMAFLFAASICTTTAVIRTINDQSIDKWLAAWFVLIIVILEKPQKTLKFALLLGFGFGMLVGTKYSGPLFALALLPVYSKILLHYFKFPRLLISIIAFTFFGLFWYIRNFFLKANPYFPANILFFKGYPNFTQQDWMLWKIPFEYPQGIPALIDAFLSEYMIWSFSGIIIIYYIIFLFYKKKSMDSRIKRVILLALSTGFVSLLLPITPAYKIELFHVVSDMRYIYIFVIMTILSVFLIANKYKKNYLVTTLSLSSAIPIFSFIPYQPKIFIICVLIAIVLNSIKLSVYKFLYK